MVNQVAFAYNAFGQPVKDQQSHSGAVNAMTTPSVQYQYASGSANTIRPTGMVYPNGRNLGYFYGDAGRTDDAASRVRSLLDDDNSAIVRYSYLGLGTPVIVDDPEPDLEYTLVGTAGGDDPDTGDIYRGLDRFGRVKDAFWYDYGEAVDAARIQYGYDRASNRIWRKDPVAESFGKRFDELYAYDGLHRLKDMQRGELNSGKTAITNETFAQCWSLDSTGNWAGMREADTGGAWTLEQSRTANPVNEISGITNAVGPAWAQPAYDPAGNMTTIPKPKDPTKEFTATYDAWNRLTKLEEDDGAEGLQTVAEYQYDARRFRIVQKNYEEGVLTETRHHYYNTGWQNLEERLGADPDTADAERQFVWGQRYIDDCLLRDRDSNADGSLDERLYALQDGNWNVIGLMNSNGAVCQRLTYSSFGIPDLFTPFFTTVETETPFDWDILFCAYTFDSSNGCYDVRHRTYIPRLGLWSQRDPLGYVGGNSLYCAYFVPDDVDPFGLQKEPITSKADCEQTVDDLLDIFEPLKALVSAIEKKCDGFKKPICSNATPGAGGAHVGGTHDPLTGVVTLYWKNIKTAGDLYVVLWHELIHAYDHCMGAPTKTTCREHVCLEARAYSCSGQCNYSDKTRLECIRTGVIQSSVNSIRCDGVDTQDLGKIVKDVLADKGCVCEKPCEKNQVPPKLPEWFTKPKAQPTPM